MLMNKEYLIRTRFWENEYEIVTKTNDYVKTFGLFKKYRLSNNTFSYNKNLIEVFNFEELYEVNMAQFKMVTDDEFESTIYTNTTGRFIYSRFGTSYVEIDVSRHSGYIESFSRAPNYLYNKKTKRMMVPLNKVYVTIKDEQLIGKQFYYNNEIVTLSGLTTTNKKLIQTDKEQWIKTSNLKEIKSI